MANINRRDSVLKGRGYSLRLSDGVMANTSNRSLLGAALANEELLFEGADDDDLLKDFEDVYCDKSETN